VELVKEALAQQPAHGGGAAGHGDVATVLGLDTGQPPGHVSADDLRVLPLRCLQVVGDHILLDRIHDVAERLVGMLGAVTRPLVVENTAHQQGVGGGEAGADRGSHLVVEVPEVPLVGRLDDAIEGNEEMRLDLAHNGPPGLSCPVASSASIWPTDCGNTSNAPQRSNCSMCSPDSKAKRSSIRVPPPRSVSCICTAV